MGGRREPKGARRATVGDRRPPKKIAENKDAMQTNIETKAEGSAQGKRRKLSAEKKFQIFIEAERGDAPVGELLRREGIYASDLARIRAQVKDGALDRLRAKPGKRPAVVAEQEYLQIKRELEEKERALAELSVELAIQRKKTNGGSWER